MKTLEVYKKYPIPNILREHHLRVAAVGACLCDNFKNPSKIDKKLVVKSLLLHDLGNIIKFDLTNTDYLTPDEIKNIEYWKKQQAIYKNKYSSDEYLATESLVSDLKLEDVRHVLSHTGTSKLEQVLRSSNWNFKIVTYADLRCSPFSVVTLNERFDDLVRRYKDRNHQLSDQKELQLRRERALELEAQLQKEILIPLDKITETDIKSLMIKVLGEEID